MATTKIGQPFAGAYNQPLSTAGALQPACYRYFYVSGSSYGTQQPVYQDAALQNPYTQPITASANGRFSPIYLNPALLYATQLFSAASALLEQADPVNFVNVIIPAVAFKATNTDRVSTAVLAIDPDLQYGIPVAGTYKYELDTVWSAGATGATPGLQFELAFSGTLNGSAGNTYAAAGCLNETAVTSGSINGTYSGQLSTQALVNVLRFSGTLQCTTAGTLALYWAQGVSNASLTRLCAGSSLTVTRLA